MNPTNCQNLPWNPITSSTAHSQLAGVIASLVFGGIVFILGQRAPDRRTHANAVALLVAGFFIFALDSFIFGVTSGEQLCVRGWTETMVAAGMLGIGALGLFTSLAWLLRTHDASNAAAFRATTMSAYLMAAIVGLQLVVTARDYLRDTLAGRQPAWLDQTLNLYVVGIVAAVVAHMVFHRRFRRLSSRVVTCTAYVTIAYGFITLATFSWVSGIVPDHWTESETESTAVTATLTSLLLPGLALILQLLALPGPVTPDNAARADDGP